MGCNGHASPSPTSLPSALARPTTLNLYPSANGNRLFVMLTGIGSQTITLPLIFDTGSAGLTLNALSGIFPEGMVGSSGFIFPAGQSTMAHDGITVTNQTVTRAYGGPNGNTFPVSIPQDSDVMIATISGFVYDFSSGAAYVPGASDATDATQVALASSSNSVVGVLYFTTNAFFIDYSSSAEGWK